jgi:hypothetical protein
MKVIGFSAVGIFAAIVSVAIPATSSAAVYNFSYSGTVTEGPDLDHPPANVHIGDTVSGTFSFDSHLMTNYEPDAAFGPLQTLSFSIPSLSYTDNFSGAGGEITSDLNKGLTYFNNPRADNRSYLFILTQSHKDYVLHPKELLGEAFAFDYGSVANGIGYFGGDVTITSISSVPEPATWGMMILGLGLAGVAARRRRQKVSARVSYAL